MEKLEFLRKRLHDADMELIKLRTENRVLREYIGLYVKPQGERRIIELHKRIKL